MSRRRLKPGEMVVSFTSMNNIVHIGVQGGDNEPDPYAVRPVCGYSGSIREVFDDDFKSRSGKLEAQCTECSKIVVTSKFETLTTLEIPS